MSYQSFDQSSVQRMNRCTGPAPCTCSITGPHQPTNRHCPRNAPLMDPQRQRELNAAAKCDGNHGGPRCADPECWNDDPSVDVPDGDQQK